MSLDENAAPRVAHDGSPAPGASAGARLLRALARANPGAPQMRLVLRAAFPPAERMKRRDVRAGAGTASLALAYARRLAFGASDLPRAVREVRSGRPLPSLVACARTVAWTVGALRDTRRQLGDTHQPTLQAKGVPIAPGGHALVRATLQLGGATCLSRSVVRQAWLTAHGQPRDIVIGVTSPTRGFAAHAWIDGDPDARGFAELVRWPPRGAQEATVSPESWRGGPARPAT